MENQPISKPIRYQKKELVIEEPVFHYTIGNTEWGLIISALFLIDAIQVILDLFAIGAVINRFIDIFIGASLALYVKLRCRHIQLGKSMTRILLTFIGEELPVVDALPFWTLDGIYNMTLERAGERAQYMKNKANAVPLKNKITFKKESGEKLKESLQKSKALERNARQPLQNIAETQKKGITKEQKPIQSGPGKVLEMEKQDIRPKTEYSAENRVALEKKILKQNKEILDERTRTPRERLDQFKEDHKDEGFDEDIKNEPDWETLLK